MESEFKFIQHIKERHGLQHIGDDCAVLPKDGETEMVLTADMLIEDVDFRLDWTSGELLGNKSLAVSLSDIAAMGATAEWAMLSIGVPKKLWRTDFMDRFYDGWHRLAAKAGVVLIGGDISRAPDKLVIDSIVSGNVAKGGAVFRSGASPGDSIFVTGSLGGAAAGLRLLDNGVRLSEEIPEWQKVLLLRQLAPKSALKTVTQIRKIKPTAMIDISDGLSSDLRHICEASGVGAAINAELLPIDANIPALTSSEDDQLELALHGGEDFELLFTADMKNNSDAHFEGFTRIGEVTATAGIIELMRGGKPEILEAKGFQHFR